MTTAGCLLPAVHAMQEVQEHRGEHGRGDDRGGVRLGVEARGAGEGRDQVPEPGDDEQEVDPEAGVVGLDEAERRAPARGRDGVGATGRLLLGRHEGAHDPVRAMLPIMSSMLDA